MRNWINLLENQMDIETLIEGARNHFGQDSLYGGNCGMFGLALAHYLSRNGVSVQIVLIHENNVHEEEVTTEDILQQELMVYHVALKHDSSYYDGDGKVSLDHIADWVEEQYGDYHAVKSEYSIDDSQLNAVMRHETKWNVPMETFLAYFDALGK